MSGKVIKGFAMYTINNYYYLDEKKMCFVGFRNQWL